MEGLWPRLGFPLVKGSGPSRHSAGSMNRPEGGMQLRQTQREKQIGRRQHLLLFLTSNGNPRYTRDMPKLGPYSQTAILSKTDGRTRESRLMRGTRAALIAHVGGKPSTVQWALIDRACQLQIRIALMDRDFAQTRAQTDHDSRSYLAWSNSLVRTLRELGVEAAAPVRETYIEKRERQMLEGAR